MDLFKARSCVLATQHGKEEVIAPLLERELGVKVLVPRGFDTDRFGTFTGEISRPANQLATARLKAQAAMDQLGLSLGVASEGSFGPHPNSAFLASNREIVLLYDTKNHLEIWGEILTTATNFASELVCQVEDALQFAQRVSFPSHALTLSIPSRIHKGITQEAELIHTFTTLLSLSQTGSVRIETDMRAMLNPTRMKVIAQATQELIQKIRSQCPACGTPGWSVVEIRRGLPCAQCGNPGQTPRAHIYRCHHCLHRQEVLFPLGIKTADPATCSFCNP
jgi:hypothetical protein